MVIPLRVVVSFSRSMFPDENPSLWPRACQIPHRLVCGSRRSLMISGVQRRRLAPRLGLQDWAQAPQRRLQSPTKILKLQNTSGSPAGKLAKTPPRDRPKTPPDRPKTPPTVPHGLPKQRIHNGSWAWRNARERYPPPLACKGS